jgi:hypothetical protein
MDIRFFADIVRTGTVLGADAELPPDVVARIFGDSYAENVNGRSYWRDYGLVEFFWYKRPRRLGWQGEHFTVQTHRLSQPLRFTDLRAALEVPLVSLRSEFGYETYWQPSSEMTVLVEQETGTVHKISSAFRLMPDVREHPADQKAVLQSLKHVIGLSEAERLAWISRKGSGDSAWWLYRSLSITWHALSWDRLVDRASWGQFALWAWSHETVDPVLAAMQVAEFLVTVDNHFAAEYPGRPSADCVVRTCLSHVTGAMSRSDKNLIDVASLHRHAVQDPSVLADLDRWIGVRADIPSASLPAL